ncbi:MAG: hypothetical protein EYC68_07555 [Chloroflexota bacterium]|nr:MAG: hypothetical protein EYC68_07555 [Chloroflexota bacterium]
MNFQENFVGALTLNQKTMVALRERSDVFLRGFLVLLFAALVAGLFASLGGAIREVAPPRDREQVIEQIVDNFLFNFRSTPEARDLMEAYIREGVSMVLEISALPPRAGEIARPVRAITTYVGNVLATPFQWGWAGWLLFAGLLFQFSSRLLGGRASMAQMLGLTSLAAAPQIFTSLTSLLALIGTMGGVGWFGSVNALLTFLIAVWSAVIYVKATSVAQNFSIGHAIGAIALGIGILIGIALVFSILFGILIVVGIGAAVSNIR